MIEVPLYGEDPGFRTGERKGLMKQENVRWKGTGVPLSAHPPETVQTRCIVVSLLLQTLRGSVNCLGRALDIASPYTVQTGYERAR